MRIISSLSSHTKKRILASGIIGNVLEAYDVVICALMAQAISMTFFPSNSAENNLLNTFYILLIGYLSRPLGGVIVALFSDQLGRKKMLVVSIIFIGISTTIIGLTPSFQQIGPASTIIFFVMRITQNLFAGGEYVSSISYLIESCHKTQRGFFGSWAAIGVNGGTLIASFIAFTTMYLIEIKALPGWGWRIPFLIAFFGMIFGFWLRISIPESLAFVLETPKENHLRNKKYILKEALSFIKNAPSTAIVICAITWFGVSITFALFIYAPIHMTTVNHLSKHVAFGINTVSLIFLIATIPLFGILSDRISRTTLLKTASALFFIAASPYFWYMSYGDYWIVLLIHIVIALPAACFFCVAPVVIAETFPVKIRCTTLSLIYHTIASIAAGATPIILIKLVQKTHIMYSPAFFIMASALFCSACLFFLGKNKIR